MNIILILPLLLFYLNSLPSPENSRIVIIFPFAFVGLIIANIVICLGWIFLDWKYMLISLLTIIIGLQYVSAIYPIASIFNPKQTEGEFKIMTYNVMLFGLYDWRNNHKLKDSIVEIIVNEYPDIICLQEVYWNDNGGKFNPLGQIKARLNYKYIHKGAMAYVDGGQNFGLATISKYPIINEKSIKFDNSYNGVLITDLIMGDDTVRVFNCHMQSIQLSQKDYTVIGAITDTLDNKKLKIIAKRIIEATQQRTEQTNIVSEHVRNSPYPVFICGDLNDFPLSYTYLSLIKGLKDTYAVKGKYPGYTWDNFGIKQRIDFIFYNRNFICTKHKVIQKSFSDHFAVIACFEKKE